MARRDLSRTVIEGGRRQSQRIEENWHTRRERNDNRVKLRKVARGVYDSEDFVDTHRKSEFYKEFADKLNPGYRWLQKQSGRLWDEVYSELRARFDTRTTAGRHFLFDHVLNTIEREGAPNYWRWYSKPEYVIGLDGVLRYFPRKRRYHRPKLPPAPPKVSEKQLRRFFRDDRRVNVDTMTWYYPASAGDSTWINCSTTWHREGGFRCSHPDAEHRNVQLSERQWGQRQHLVTPMRYRQGKKLTESEIRTWEKLGDLQSKYKMPG